MRTLFVTALCALMPFAAFGQDSVTLTYQGSLASAAGNTIRVWDLSKRDKLVHTLKGHTGIVSSVCWLGGERRVRRLGGRC